VFDIGALEFLVLAIAALFIFGPDRLPDMARQAARGLRQVRNMAANARRELSKELGPEFEDLDIRDLNPRSFVRKHVLDGIDEDDLRFDRDLDLRDDLRVDDEPAKKKVNGNGSVNGASRAGGVDTATDTATATGTAVDTVVDDDAEDATTVDAATSADDTDSDLAPVQAAPPPYDTEAT